MKKIIIGILALLQVMVFPVTSLAYPKITQTPVVENFEKSKVYKKYEDFFKYKSIIIPGLKTDAVPQGMTYSGNYIYVSAYDFNKDNYSCIHVINKSSGKYVKTVWLKGDYSHVGGIANDGKYLYVACSSGSRIGKVKLSKLNSTKNGKSITLSYIDVKTDKNKKYTASYCTYDIRRKVLWVGKFNIDSDDYAYGYKINGTKAILKYKIKTPPKTQGLYFGAKYVYYSTSYGRNTTSHIYRCYIEDSKDIKDIINYTYSIKTDIPSPPTSENIFISNDKLYVLFENASSVYYKNSDNPSKYPVDRICKHDLK